MHQPRKLNVAQGRAGLRQGGLAVQVVKRPASRTKYQLTVPLLQCFSTRARLARSEGAAHTTVHPCALLAAQAAGGQASSNLPMDSGFCWRIPRDASIPLSILS